MSTSRKRSADGQDENGVVLKLPPVIGQAGRGDLELAMTCVRCARGHRVSAQALGKVLGSAFRSIYQTAREVDAKEVRRTWPWAYVRNLYPDDSPESVRFLDALDEAARSVELEPDDPLQDEAEAFDLGLIDNRTFASREHRANWLARGILVEGEACVLGGPSKAMKTSVLVDLAVSLASGSPFLGRFEVGEPVPVMIISGESGPRVLQATARQVCEARGFRLEDAGAISWGFTIPRLSDPTHLDAIRRAIDATGSRVVAIDPLYLALLAGSSNVDAANMYQMGPLLAGVASACLDSGCTPILAHHARKHREDPLEPMTLEELAFAGIGQFCRQWLLLSRREKFEPDTGLHRMHLVYGGSAGHAGHLHLDIETGQLDDNFEGRVWNVSTARPSENMAEVQAERKAKAEADRQQRKAEKAAEKAADMAAQLEADAAACLRAVRSLAKDDPPVTATSTSIRTRAKIRGERASLALDALIESGQLERYVGRIANANATRAADAYREPAPKPLAAWEAAP